MKEFLMLFRHTPNSEIQPTQEQIQASMKQWKDWIADIAAQGKFVATNQLGKEGKTVKPGNVITDGPYTELKEIIGGYIIVRAASIDEAISMAEGCPIFFIGGNVEVRDIMNLN